MLKKRDRLTARDIESLSLGKSVFGTLVSLRYVASNRSKFSVSVSKKSFPKAVDRNLLRRRIYAVLDDLLARIRKPAYVMIMPKKECMDAPIQVLSADITSLMTKAGLFA